MKLLAAAGLCLLLASCGGTPTPDGAPRASVGSVPTASSPAGPPPSDVPLSVPATPAQLVRDPKARLGGYASAPGHPERAAALWSWCPHPSRNCSRARLALAVTRDGFRTSRVVGLRRGSFPGISALGEDAFFVNAYPRFSMVRTDGSVTRLRATGPVRPVGPGEVVALAADRTMAVDPATGTAHRIPLPSRAKPDVEVSAQGQLRVVHGHTYAWSADGGATWSRRALTPVAAEAQPVWALVPTAEAGTQAVLEGGNGATLLLFEALHVANGGSFSAIPGPQHPFVAVDGGAWLLADGRLVVAGDWTDGRGNTGGVCVFAAGACTPVPQGAPFDGKHRVSPYVVDWGFLGDGLRLVAIAPDRVSAWSTTDLGRHWRRVPVR